MSTKKIDAVKYRANDYRVDKKGKRTATKFSFWVRAGGQWTTAAESGDERAEQYRGVFSVDVAAFKLPDVMDACGLEVPEGVRTAADEAEERLNALLRKREAREDATVARGWDAFRDAKADAAVKSWERLTASVEERASQRARAEAKNGDKDATDTTAETAGNAANVAA